MPFPSLKPKVVPSLLLATVMGVGIGLAAGYGRMRAAEEALQRFPVEATDREALFPVRAVTREALSVDSRGRLTPDVLGLPDPPDGAQVVGRIGGLQSNGANLSTLMYHFPGSIEEAMNHYESAIGDAGLMPMRNHLSGGAEYTAYEDESAKLTHVVTAIPYGDETLLVLSYGDGGELLTPSDSRVPTSVPEPTTDPGQHWTLATGPVGQQRSTSVYRLPEKDPVMVRTFYLDNLKQRGWEAQEVESGGGNIRIEARRSEGARLVVTISALDVEGGTTAVVSYDPISSKEINDALETEG